jgi:hypothetical protein
MELNFLLHVARAAFDHDNDHAADTVGVGHYYLKEPVSSGMITNISTVVGKTVHLNCSLARDLYGVTGLDYADKYSANNKQQPFSRFKQYPIGSGVASSADYRYRQQDSLMSAEAALTIPTPPNPTTTTSTTPSSSFKSDYLIKRTLTFNPTWLKADVIYNQFGSLEGYKTENIIVTRKGIITDTYRERMKLISLGDKMQVLKINEVDVRDEGKYICREFNSKIDRSFYLNVYCNLKKQQKLLTQQNTVFSFFN